MDNYLLIYHGAADPDMTEDEVARLMGLWGEWIESLGDRFVDPGNPVEKSWTVSQDGATEGWTDGTPVAGYGIIRASSYSEACEMAAGCPDIREGTANIQVAKIYVLE